MLFIFPNFHFWPFFSLLLYDAVKRFSVTFFYEFKSNQSAADTLRKINQAFSNDSVNERLTLIAKFHSGDFTLEDEPQSGRPTAIQDEDLRALVETDR